MDYPELAARTRRFTYGAPRGVSVASDGTRVVFLRSTGPEDRADRLWVLDLVTGAERLIADPAELLAGGSADLPAPERALRERMRLSAGGIGSYATDPAARVAAFPLAGRLFRADLVHGDVVELPAAGPVVDPRPDPTGRRIAYVTGGALHVVTDDGTDVMLAGEDGGAGPGSRSGGANAVTWGLAEFIAAEEFDRHRGYWWSPDGRSILAT
ncbi:MAG TPA: DPP IV N-terminal domain-containing protein, partial [Pilimelia sp.]|nr:DPP IV N-terminal domain-containing protein [Pilimelia sp.]